jgi:hypothetical protein
VGSSKSFPSPACPFPPFPAKSSRRIQTPPLNYPYITRGVWMRRFWNVPLQELHSKICPAGFRVPSLPGPGASLRRHGRAHRLGVL